MNRHLVTEPPLSTRNILLCTHVSGPRIRTGPFLHTWVRHAVRVLGAHQAGFCCIPSAGAVPSWKQGRSRGQQFQEKSRWANDSTHFTNEENEARRSSLNSHMQITWSSNWALTRWTWLALNSILFCICSSLQQLEMWAREPEASSPF